MTGPAGFGRPSSGVLRLARSLSSRKGREAAGAFVVDGAQAVREAVLAPGAVKHLYAVAGNPNADEFAALAVSHSGATLYELTEREMAQVTDTVTPQGIAALCHDPTTRWPPPDFERLASPRLVVVCAQVRDPGNAGTVIRCADAFGADAVVLTSGSVEATNPKTVRASVGSIFHLPVFRDVALVEAVAFLRGKGLQVLAADGGGEPLTEVDLTRPTAWVMGNEAWGLPPGDAALADRAVAIPMWGRAESLNLSTAAAVCLYATAAAQRAAR